MPGRLRAIEEIKISNVSMIKHIENLRNSFSSLPDIDIVSYGPTTPSDNKPVILRKSITGSQLRRASTNSAQGYWLTRLATYVGRRSGRKVNILELGSAAGVSGLYILAGIASAFGGRLISFEGSAELAEMAKRHMTEFVMNYNLGNVDFEVVVGPFKKTLEEHIGSFSDTFHMASIDGDHLEESTIKYHNYIRPYISNQGVIMYDDIDWSPGMVRAWKHIKDLEGQGRAGELHLGGRPKKGLILLESAPEGRTEIMHMDKLPERFARIVYRAIFP